MTFTFIDSKVPSELKAPTHPVITDYEYMPMMNMLKITARQGKLRGYPLLPMEAYDQIHRGMHLPNCRIEDYRIISSPTNPESCISS